MTGNVLGFPAQTVRTLLILFLLLALPLSSGHGGGVVYDGTTGASGSLTGPNYRITSDRGTTVGSNLFHSFSTFNLSKGDIATFSGPNSINNVISRVTGGSASTIDGKISSQMNGANFYFINPWGIMFGPNASLDVSGSFHVSTASHMKFADGAIFSATDPGRSILTSAPPAAFGFLANPSPITVQGSHLSVPEGKELSFVGGNIQMSGATIQSGGRINLASVASPGDVTLTPTGIDTASIATMSDMTINNGSHLSVASATTTGNIFVRANRFVLSGSTIELVPTGSVDAGTISVSTRSIEMTNLAEITSSSSSNAKGGNIELSATESILISGKDNSSGYRAMIDTGTEGSGDGGSISLSAPRIDVKDGASIQSYVGGDGKGGTITLSATDSILISGQAGIWTDTHWKGNGGDISISAPRIEVRDGGGIQTDTHFDGKGGNISLLASDSFVASGARIATNTVQWQPVPSMPFYIIYGKGDAGNISVSAPRIEMKNSATIGSTSTSSGQAGNITLSATDSILIAGDKTILPNDMNRLQTGIWSHGYTMPGTVLHETKGAGTISLSAPRIEMRDGGFIAASTYTVGKGGSIDLSATESILLSDLALIDASTYGFGDAGSVSLSAPRIEMNGGAEIGAITKYYKGKGGNVTLSGGESIRITGVSSATGQPTGIFSDTQGNGDAGSISLSAPRIEVSDGAHIQSAASYGSSEPVGSGKGGNINISGADSLLVTGQDTYITVSTSGTGDAGTVSLTAPAITITDGAIVDAVTTSDGKGGDVNLSASNSILVTGQNTFIGASTYGTGNAGSVSLSAPLITIAEGGEIAASTYADGKGGNISLAAGELTILNKAIISSRSEGAGTAGDITIQAASLKMDHGAITAETANADGGNIVIATGGLVEMINSDMTAQVRGGTGNGGNITINARYLVMDPSSIVANAEYGNGGNIWITCDAFIKSLDSTVSASSTYGNNGSILISSPVTNLLGNLVAAPGGFLDVNTLSPLQCIPPEQEGASTFRIRGREGLPARP